MRELVLLRHAHAIPGHAGLADENRPLSPAGQVQAWAAGAWLQAECPPPSRVLCSPARRTRETLDAVMRSTGALPLRLEPGIYEAETDTLAGLVEHNRDATPLWLIGHNPGLEKLLLRLCSPGGDFAGLPPCGLVRLEIHGEATPAQARLLALHTF